MYEELFRHSAKVGLITVDAAERLLEYRNLRNDTAHLYDDELLRCIRFIKNAEKLAMVVGEDFDE